MRKRGLPDPNAPKPKLTPEAEKLLKVIVSRSELPQKKRVHIKPDEKVPLELNEHEN